MIQNPDIGFGAFRKKLKTSIMNRHCVLAVGLVFLSLVGAMTAEVNTADKIFLGALFEQNTEEIQNVFKYALSVHNQNISSKRVELQAFLDIFKAADVYELSRLICRQFGNGVFAMVGAMDPESFDTVHSYTNTFHVPFITPWFPEKVNPPSSGLNDYAVSMRPDTHKAIIDVILHYGWKEFIYIYDSDDGLLRLQQIYAVIKPGNTPFRIYYIKYVSNVSDAMRFLEDLEEIDHWNNKHIVLDSSSSLAKAILLGHVRNPRLGRRTYHYILSGLVLDEQWQKNMIRHGALNVTGLRMVDPSKKIVQEFVEGFRKVDPRFGGSVSATSALMYDSVQVLMDSFGRLWKKKPDAFRSVLRRVSAQNSSSGSVCKTGKGTPFEHGDKLSRLIKKTNITGLTGNITFNEEGRRTNYTLHVMEMTVQSVMVKVATWTDGQGLVANAAHHEPLKSPVSYDTNRTYIITSLLEEPFLMMKVNENETEPADPENPYHGFCKELAEIISETLGIKHEFRLVKDGNHGKEVSPKVWNGIIGEIQSKEADIGIAPLIMTKRRQKVVDFSEPFLTLEVPSVPRKRARPFLSGLFYFLQPMSIEVWMCIVASFFALSVIMSLVTNFLPFNWCTVPVPDACLKKPPKSSNEIVLKKPLNVWNKFLLAIRALIQRKTDGTPKFVSGTIMNIMWVYVLVVIICAYISNLMVTLYLQYVFDPVPEDSSSIIFETPEGAVPIHVSDIEQSAKATGDSSFYRAGGLSCPFHQYQFSIAVAKGSPLREAISIAVVNLRRSGFIGKLWRKWLFTTIKPIRDIVSSETTFATPITLSDLSGLFYLVGMGLFFSFCVALLEIYVLLQDQDIWPNTRFKLTQSQTNTCKALQVDKPYGTYFAGVIRSRWYSSFSRGYNTA